jgi:peptidoglycan/LPS O-acetylase OafA/YrhL
MQPKAAFNNNLHGLRGLLALGVVVGHCGVAHVESVAVWFFFVLSGYLLASLYRDGMRPDQLGAYALRRAARLLPLYAIVLAVIAVVPAEIYNAALRPAEAAKFEAIAATVLEHLTFTRGNIHFWTLAQEMAGYVLIAALMLARTWLRLGLFVALCGAVAVASEFISIPMASDTWRPFYAFHFIVGVVAAMVPVRGAAKPWASTAALAILVAIFIAGVFESFIKAPYHADLWHELIPAPLWGLIGGVVILGLAHGRDVLDRLAFFGTISYGLYVFHYLVLLALAEPVSRMTAGQTLLVVSAITIPLAWSSYRLIEAPYIAFAHRITRRARPDVVPAVGN